MSRHEKLDLALALILISAFNAGLRGALWACACSVTAGLLVFAARSEETKA